MARVKPNGGARAKDTKKTFKRLIQYLLHERILLVFAGVCVIFSSLASIAGTFFLKPVIDDYITPMIGNKTAELVSSFITILIVMGGIYLLGALSNYISNRLMVLVANRTLFRMRSELFNHLQDLPISYFDSRTHGEIMSRFSNDIDSIRETLSNSFPQLLSSSMTVVGTFVMMLILSPLLTLLIVFMIVVMVLVVKKIGGRSRNYFRQQQKNIGIANGYVEEMVEGQRVIKVFNHEDKVKDEFLRINTNLRQSSRKAHTFASILMPIMGNLSYLNYAITAAAGATIYIYWGIGSIGTIISFLLYTKTFSNPITMISQQLNSILAALAGAERLFEILDEEKEVDDGYITLVNVKEENGTLVECSEASNMWAWKDASDQDNVIYTQVKGDVRFKDVTFGYVPEKTVLHNISLFAKPGQKIAFVGSTGAGKTTITNLVNRFYDIDEGEITYDGINIKNIKKDDLRRSLAMVLQDSHLFTGTVKDNIRYGKLDATDEEIVAAAKLANADFFIRNLPQGYDTVLSGDGGNLSQGQRQLLTIARAAVANPPVLVLDEATSSIDTRTEYLIEKGMDRLMENRTVFVIAHRLSTVRNSNAIMVIEGGQIVERGDHDELLDKKGRYYQLYTGQFELE